MSVKKNLVCEILVRMEKLVLYMVRGYVFNEPYCNVHKKGIKAIFLLVLILIDFCVLDDTKDPLLNNDGNFKIQRRTFYLRLVKKVASRDEQPEVELVHVMGTLMVQKSDSKSTIYYIIDVLFLKKVTIN